MRRSGFVTAAFCLLTLVAGCRPYGTICGDGVCEGSETATTCPGDCGPPVCGDSSCASGRGETCSTCALDCGACPGCPDGG